MSEYEYARKYDCIFQVGKLTTTCDNNVCNSLYSIYKSYRYYLLILQEKLVQENAFPLKFLVHVHFNKKVG